MRKMLKVIISVILSVACLAQPCCGFAASFAGKTYVKEMIISYGKTEDEAKKWLTDKGYTVIDHNINEGADDTLSTKRAVYLGYKTTKNADEAVTDMKLMNMTGGYSTLDYQMLLKDQEKNIQAFISNFITAINEYRENYKKGRARAAAVHEMLNLMYDDDTEQELGDLFLEKIREEYTDEQLGKMSDDELNEHASMTTILMQSNATSVLAIEQLIAIASDSNDTLWMERYADAPTYDEMVDNLMDSEGITVSAAMARLAAEYDDDANAIADKISAYKEYLANYEKEDVSIESSKKELQAYADKEGYTDMAVLITAGTQKEALSELKNSDGESLLDIITDEDYNLSDSTEYRYLLYPLVSVLSDGQRACLDFLTMYQIVSIGMNGDDSLESVTESLGIDKEKKGSISIYDGVDRSIYSADVAMTGEAYSLQNSSDKDVSTNWYDDGISDSAKLLYLAFGCTVAATIATFTVGNLINSAACKVGREFAEVIESNMVAEVGDYSVKEVQVLAEKAAEEVADGAAEGVAEGAVEIIAEDASAEEVSLVEKVTGQTMYEMNSARNVARYFRYAGIGLATISIVIMGISLWKTYNDLKAYYNTTLTPIPNYMVDEGIGENNEKTYTYYKAVLCNREESQFTTDRTKVLKAYGDINGDVGKQWVALYTTKDKAAGDPITADFTVQYANSDIPGETTPLSIFCESTAQNLTNKKANYTYADGKNGIYLFYGTDSTALAGSAVSNGTYALIGGGSFIVFGLITFFVSKNIRKRKEKADA